MRKMLILTSIHRFITEMCCVYMVMSVNVWIVSITTIILEEIVREGDVNDCVDIVAGIGIHSIYFYKITF